MKSRLWTPETIAQWQISNQTIFDRRTRWNYFDRHDTFTSRACNKQQLVKINKFSVEKFEWTTKNFSMLMINNFYGCHLNILYNNDRYLASLFLLKRDEHGRFYLFNKHGFFLNLMEELTSYFNFNEKRFIYDTDRKRYFYCKTNGKIVDLSKQPLADWWPDMCPVFANAFLTSMISSPVISESLQLAVPPGIAYTPHEKFLLPFDDTTWVLLSLVFLFAFSVVFILMLVKSFSLNSFVLGDNVSTPGLNIYAVFMGIG